MRKIALVGLISLLVLSGVAVGREAEEKEKDSSMQRMMDEMMKGDKGERHGMMGMMEDMTKMHDACLSMMGSHADAGKTQEKQKK